MEVVQTYDYELISKLNEEVQELHRQLYPEYFKEYNYEEVKQFFKQVMTKAAVVRECLEEIGCAVEVEDIVHIRAYTGNNHEFAEWDYDVHQVEFYFECRLAGAQTPNNGRNPDDNQVGVEWIEIDRLHEKKFTQGTYRADRK
ncbi:NUDIX domain-containing protein [Paenibacillus assamensis]|uniref:NUDIX domain-containing protein n=1 Tax=Paenibacillus assamensis TaxID=311244 RepID=UPI00041565D3|nr:NUDIX domain-containing protein [Paenibacillus assamensis]